MDRYKPSSSSKFFLCIGLISVVMTGLIIIVVLNAASIIAYAQNFTSSSSSSPILSKGTVMGAVIGIQKDIMGKTNWIVGGVYNMSKTNTVNPTFNSIFYMIKTDGTAPHKHTISDFKISGKPVVANNSTIFNGTVTVTMKEGPIKDVPISIKFRDQSSVSMWLDPTKTKSHFGSTLIYGIQHLICNETPSYCRA